MSDPGDRDEPCFVVDPVHHSIDTSPRRVLALKRLIERTADPIRRLLQRPVKQFDDGCCRGG